ncbi:hypothetical protein HHK36_032373 [Tetracentron sinense]|uniref:Retroviral polymerase SH3-like domain-containing protein n=1 Tax=Tetracentron sinense TaxID=13715 RepID=A0A834YAD1_TETSI|nr:hypothetical protein HHK36_032373 [Tetracentron sinense]
MTIGEVFLSGFLQVLFDRCPTKSVKNKTPQEAWSGYKPSVSHLKIFGCIAYAQVPEAKRKKLDDRGEKCIFIGYSEESKAYKFYNPLTNKVVVSRDVIFSEEETWNWDKEEKIKENQIEIEEQEADHGEQNQENMRQTISTPAPRESSSIVWRSPDARLITPEELVSSLSIEDVGMPTRLECLTILNCDKLEKLAQGLYDLTFLRKIIIKGCSGLVSFPEIGLPSMLRMSQKTAQSKESKDKCKNTNWNSPMERVCIETLTNEYNKGNKGDNGWKPQAYQAVINAIYEKLGISLNKEQKMVTADDSVWDEYLKSHSNARPYRTKSIPDFDSLSLIIANDSANGNGMLSGFDAEHTTNQDDTFSRGTNIEDMRTGLEDLHERDNPIRNEVPAPSAPLGASSSRLNNEARKKKKTRREGSLDELSAMNANLRFIAEAINNTTAEVDMEPLMVELEKIPELDEDLIIEAAEYLSSDKKRVNLFYGMNDNLRTRWLRKRLRP